MKLRFGSKQALLGELLSEVHWSSTQQRAREVAPRDPNGYFHTKVQSGGGVGWGLARNRTFAYMVMRVLIGSLEPGWAHTSLLTQVGASGYSSPLA